MSEKIEEKLQEKIKSYNIRVFYFDYGIYIIKILRKNKINYALNYEWKHQLTFDTNIELILHEIDILLELKGE